MFAQQLLDVIIGTIREKPTRQLFKKALYLHYLAQYWSLPYSVYLLSFILNGRKKKTGQITKLKMFLTDRAVSLGIFLVCS